jgi:hypothetical protein
MTVPEVSWSLPEASPEPSADGAVIAADRVAAGGVGGQDSGGESETIVFGLG